MENKKKHSVCMISDMHNMFDDRIYFKEALSLKNAGYQVYHICVGDINHKFMSDEGIYIIQLRRFFFLKNRILNKILKTFFCKNIYKQIQKEAVKINTDIYHFHDYKLIKPARKIQAKTGSKIIFDAHDPYYQNIIGFNSENYFKKTISLLYSRYIQYLERKYLPFFDKIITTEENLANYYKNIIGFEPDIIYNYTTFKINNVSENKKYDFIYCGKITAQRSVLHIIKAIYDVKKYKKNVKVVFVGKIVSSVLKKQIFNLIEELILHENVIFTGKIPYKNVVNYYKQSKIGLAVFQKIPVHYIILQIKLFEYTTLGLPIIGSNFGHVKRYIEKDKTGLLVEPDNSNNIAKKMIKLLENNELYEQFRKNTLEAALNYQWSIMEKKLLEIYENIIKR